MDAGAVANHAIVVPGLGGCRCQALLLAAMLPQPTRLFSLLATLRSQVDAVLAEVAAIPAADAGVRQPPWLYRPNPA